MRIAVENLTVGYNNKPVLSKANFSLEENMLVALIGGNGSGKSTLLKTLLSEIPVIEGEITPYTEGEIAFLPQEIEDPPFITVSQVLEIGCRRGAFQVKTNEIMATCEIQDLAERKFSELSGGEKKRVWLAFALLQNTEVIFLDEPFSAIDYDSRDDFYNLLHGFCVNGRSILVVSHDINLVFKHADKILEIKDGNIKELPKH